MATESTFVPARRELGGSLRDLVTHPRETLWAAWSWKAAALSAVFRAGTFWATNLKAGHGKALHALIVEAVFAVFAAGLLGAVSQHLRNARPYWATALIVWILMPLLITLAQFGVHHLAGTPHLGAGLFVSFLFAAIASSFSWYAMARGALLGGADSTTVEHDLKRLPRIVLDYVCAVPRMIFGRSRSA